jgi:glycosyltransferase involved in cell wall biosynthesis
MLTLVVPVYNEEFRWNYEYWSSLLQSGQVKILFVNDGSTDGTGAILRGFVRTNLNSLVINLRVNSGKSEAIRAGFRVAIEDKSELIGFLDADGAFEIQEVQSVIAQFNQGYFELNSLDAVWSSRVKLLGSNIVRDDSRHYIGRIIHTVIGLWIKELPYDSQAGFKIFKSSPELCSAVSRPFKTRWFVDLELLIRLRTLKRDLSIIEFPIQNWRDISGSKIRLTSFFVVILDLVKLFSVRKNFSPTL